jgi:phosphoglycerol transferase MdoB-like AlkP superfamily enzyme
MEYLLRRLNEAGVADKTVITITPDHYPYGLEQKDGDKYAVWREVLGHDVDTTFELYKSNFILYCQGTKDAPTIDKYCYSVDILPTMLNLFGFEYDSRLLMGSDILSTSNQLVIFLDRSFITERGMYDAGDKTFTLFEGVEEFENEEEEEKYINAYKSIVNNKFQVSAKIIETDYYGYLFDE